MTQRKVAANGPGEHLVQELKWVHNTIRQDLRTLQDLSGQIGLGASAAAVQNKVRSLRTKGPLWQLRVNCLRYCSFVHAHHGIEDATLFPRLRRSNPALGSTVDRLEADHRKVSDLLDQVQSLASLLTTDDGKETRQRLVDAINELDKHLLEHLAFEEKAISPTLRQWSRWPD